MGPTNTTAELKVTRKYHQLYQSLIELITALNVLEPGGTLVDDVTFETNEDGKVRVSYTGTPIQLTIKTPERTFLLRVLESIGDKDSPMKRRKIDKRALKRSL